MLRHVVLMRKKSSVRHDRDMKRTRDLKRLPLWSRRPAVSSAAARLVPAGFALGLHFGGAGTPMSAAQLSKGILPMRGRAVADDPMTASGYLDQAQEMRLAAERAVDPSFAIRYLLLAAEWLRLAERRRDTSTPDVELVAERQALASKVATLKFDERVPTEPTDPIWPRSE
jgi:hypothetical protein